MMYCSAASKFSTIEIMVSLRTLYCIKIVCKSSSCVPVVTINWKEQEHSATGRDVLAAFPIDPNAHLECGCFASGIWTFIGLSCIPNYWLLSSKSCWPTCMNANAKITRCIFLDKLANATLCKWSTIEYVRNAYCAKVKVHILNIISFYEQYCF